MSKAIVLSGGGARGAYQIGVWKALRKLNIKYDIVTGTSVGSLNGALMASNDYYKANFIWRNLEYKRVFDKDLDHLELKDIISEYAKASLKDGGMEVSNLEKNLRRFFNPRKFFNSKIKYGLITVNLSTLKPSLLTKDKLSKDNIIDYLVASSTCYPLFKKKDINGQIFIDGGYFDNLPINLAVNMGATEIIAVDLHAIGLKRKILNNNVKITYIEPRNDIGSFLVFNKTQALRSIKYGYNDTLKTFKVLDGNRFTFKINSLEDNFNRYGETFTKYMLKLSKFQDERLLKKLLLERRHSRLIKDKDAKMIRKEFNSALEYLGTVFKFDETKVYNIKKYNKLLTKKIDSLKTLDINIIDSLIKQNDLENLFNSKWIIKYLVENMTDPKKRKKVNTLTFIFRKEFIAALYLLIIKNE